MSQYFSQAEINNYKKDFSNLDLDSNGEITPEELGTVLASHGDKLSTTKLKEMVAEVDTDRSGTIDFEEFLMVVYNMKMGKSSQLGGVINAKKAFLQKVKEANGETGPRTWKDDRNRSTSEGKYAAQGGKPKGPPPKKSITDLP